MRQIGDDLLGVYVGDHRPDRNAHNDILAPPAVAAGRGTIFATLGSGMQVDADVRRWLGALLYAVSLALGIVVWRRWKAHSTSAGDVRQGR